MHEDVQAEQEVECEGFLEVKEEPVQEVNEVPFPEAREVSFPEVREVSSTDLRQQLLFQESDEAQLIKPRGGVEAETQEGREEGLRSDAKMDGMEIWDKRIHWITKMTIHMKYFNIGWIMSKMPLGKNVGWSILKGAHSPIEHWLVW